MESLTSHVKSAGEMPEAKRAAMAQKDEAILLLLARLALLYWRPDFTPGQAKQLYVQYLEDLRDFAFSDVSEAIQKYRRNPENKFFPLPGQLRGIIETVPSWDVISRREHLIALRASATRELDDMACDVRLLASPLAAE